MIPLSFYYDLPCIACWKMFQICLLKQLWYYRSACGAMDCDLQCVRKEPSPNCDIRWNANNIGINMNSTRLPSYGLHSWAGLVGNHSRDRDSTKSPSSMQCGSLLGLQLLIILHNEGNSTFVLVVYAGGEIVLHSFIYSAHFSPLCLPLHSI